MKGYTTKAIHSSFLKKDVHNALHMPIYESVSFEFESSEDIEAAFLGSKPAHAYSRITNPTVENFEQKIKAITGAFAAVALSSGMAAISNFFMTIGGAGSHVVASKFLFGNTTSLFATTLKKWGLEVSFVDIENIAEVKTAITDQTIAVFTETIANPQMRVADLEALSVVTKEAMIPLVVDTTVTPPYLFKSKDWGVDVEVLSSTKYISGGATTVGGLIIDNGTYKWKNNPYLETLAKKMGPFALVASLKKEIFRNMGACLSPHNAAIQSIGLETLALRADRSCENTLAVAEFLKGHARVKNVNYPGLESSEYYEVSKKLFPNLPGAILTFELDSKEECYTMMNALKLVRRSTNLNDNKTLIIHPSSTIYAEFSEDEKVGMEVTSSMIRLAVGIEDLEDLLEDLKQGLNQL